MKIRLLELFGGIGAPRKALERLNIDFEVVDYVEIDKYAVKSYNAIYNEKFEPQDIMTWDKNIEVDIITHGSPCQDFSIAGLQLGASRGGQTRSSLMYETVRIVKKLKPQYVIWENVPNVLSKKHIHNFQNYIQFLDNLGYKSAYEVLNAKDYGIPQNRERLFVVSVLNGRTRDLLGLELYFDFPQPIQLKLKLKDMLESNVCEKYYISNTKIKKIITSNFAQEKAIIQTTDICGTILARDYKDPKCVPINSSEPKCEVVATLDIPGRFESACRVHGIDGIAPACNTCGGGGHETKIAEPIIIDDIYKNREPREYGDTAPTLRTNCQGLKVFEPKTNERFFRQAIETANENECENGDTINAFNKTVDKTGISPTITTRPEGFKTAILPIVNYRVRKLTPKECWRLMGFDDEDFKKAKKVNSDTQLYKQAGNSIVINVLEAIFKELFKL